MPKVRRTFSAHGVVSFANDYAEDRKQDSKDQRGNSLRSAMQQKADQGHDAPSRGEAIPDVVATHVPTIFDLRLERIPQTLLIALAS